MLEIARATEFSAALSVPTLDERAWRATEPHTPNPRARLEAVAELNRAGIPHGRADRAADAGDQRRARAGRATAGGARHEAGRTSISGVALHLRAGVREVFMDWLGAQRPELAARYEELYRQGAYAPKEERARLSALVRRGGVGAARRAGQPRGSAAAPRGAMPPPMGGRQPRSEQKRLF